AHTTYEMICAQYRFQNLLKDDAYNKICLDMQRKVEQLLFHLNQYAPSFFERLTDYALGLTAQYLLLRVHLLKFLAILPGLDHDKGGKEVKRMLLESLRRLIDDSDLAVRHFKIGQEKALPNWMRQGFNLFYKVSEWIPAYPLAYGVRVAVKFMARRFIAGESIEKASKSFRSLFETQRQVTLDQLGELVVSEREADRYAEDVIKLIKGFSLHVLKGEKNLAGINKANVSIKVSALSGQFRPEAFDFTYGQVGPRLQRIFLAALEHDVFINVDAEHYHYRDVVFKIYRKVLLTTPELKDFKTTGIVLQAYLKDAAAHLDEIIALAKERGGMMPIRIVKGAYWDAETVEGRACNFNPPEFLNKEETDLNFRAMIYKIFENFP
ncbi:MAG: proline dehydrogenase family protein, partial [Bdellovibrionota bacterium]